MNLGETSDEQLMKLANADTSHSSLTSRFGFGSSFGGSDAFSKELLELDQQAQRADQKQAEMAHTQWALFREQIGTITKELMEFRIVIQTMQKSSLACTSKQDTFAQQLEAERKERLTFSERCEARFLIFDEGLQASKQRDQTLQQELQRLRLAFDELSPIAATVKAFRSDTEGEFRRLDAGVERLESASVALRGRLDNEVSSWKRQLSDSEERMERRINELRASAEESSKALRVLQISDEEHRTAEESLRAWADSELQQLRAHLAKLQEELESESRRTRTALEREQDARKRGLQELSDGEARARQAAQELAAEQLRRATEESARSLATMERQLREHIEALMSSDRKERESSLHAALVALETRLSQFIASNRSELQTEFSEKHRSTLELLDRRWGETSSAIDSTRLKCSEELKAETAHLQRLLEQIESQLSAESKERVSGLHDLTKQFGSLHTKLEQEALERADGDRHMGLQLQQALDREAKTRAAAVDGLTLRVSEVSTAQSQEHEERELHEGQLHGLMEASQQQLLEEREERRQEAGSVRQRFQTCESSMREQRQLTEQHVNEVQVETQGLVDEIRSGLRIVRQDLKQEEKHREDGDENLRGSMARELSAVSKSFQHELAEVVQQAATNADQQRRALDEEMRAREHGDVMQSDSYNKLTEQYRQLCVTVSDQERIAMERITQSVGAAESVLRGSVLELQQEFSQFSVELKEDVGSIEARCWERCDRSLSQEAEVRALGDEDLRRQLDGWRCNEALEAVRIERSERESALVGLRNMLDRFEDNGHFLTAKIQGDLREARAALELQVSNLWSALNSHKHEFEEDEEITTEELVVEPAALEVRKSQSQAVRTLAVSASAGTFQAPSQLPVQAMQVNHLNMGTTLGSPRASVGATRFFSAAAPQTSMVSTMSAIQPATSLNLAVMRPATTMTQQYPTSPMHATRRTSVTAMDVFAGGDQFGHALTSQVTSSGSVESATPAPAMSKTTSHIRKKFNTGSAKYSGSHGGSDDLSRITELAAGTS